MLNKLIPDGIFTINDNSDRNFTDVRRNTISAISMLWPAANR
ncbi:hypothetical protein O5623_07310 [Escherichia coli]|nr:hypothetical protein [Escherichia coli]